MTELYTRWEPDFGMHLAPCILVVHKITDRPILGLRRRHLHNTFRKRARLQLFLVRRLSDLPLKRVNPPRFWL